MIILDTNVLSETVNTPPSGRVLRWLAEQDGSEVFVTAITQAEMFYGVEAMPHGKRRLRVLAAAERLFNEDFGTVSSRSKIVLPASTQRLSMTVAWLAAQSHKWMR